MISHLLSHKSYLPPQKKEIGFIPGAQDYLVVLASWVEKDSEIALRITEHRMKEK